MRIASPPHPSSLPISPGVSLPMECELCPDHTVVLQRSQSVSRQEYSWGSQNPLHPCKLLNSSFHPGSPPQNRNEKPFMSLDVRHKARTILHRLQTSSSEMPASRGTPRREGLGPHSLGHHAPCPASVSFIMGPGRDNSLPQDILPKVNNYELFAETVSPRIQNI